MEETILFMRFQELAKSREINRVDLGSSPIRTIQRNTTPFVYKIPTTIKFSRRKLSDII